MTPTKTQFRKAMLPLVAECTDLTTGEVCATKLAEGAALALDCDHVGGPLDHETHAIWDVALAVSEASRAT